MAPGPPEVRFPVMRQRWREVAFVSWPAPPDAIRRRLPTGLELDTLDDHGWLSIVAFGVDAEAPVSVPGLPAVEGAGQANLRTYVRGPGGEAGLYIFSADVSSRPLALAARLAQFPYLWADVEIEVDPDVRRYTVQRRPPPGEPARVELEVRVGEWLPGGALTVLDRFLVERFHVFASFGPALLGASAEHPPWRLRRAQVTRLGESLTRASDLPAASRVAPHDLVAHWSEGVEVKLGMPVPVGVRKAAL